MCKPCWHNKMVVSTFHFTEVLKNSLKNVDIKKQAEKLREQVMHISLCVINIYAYICIYVYTYNDTQLLYGILH